MIDRLTLLPHILFDKDGRAWSFAPPAERESRWPFVDLARSAWCRLRGHPKGIVYYNPNGLEPDYTCRNCGDGLS